MVSSRYCHSSDDALPNIHKQMVIHSQLGCRVHGKNTQKEKVFGVKRGGIRWLGLNPCFRLFVSTFSSPPKCKPVCLLFSHDDSEAWCCMEIHPKLCHFLLLSPLLEMKKKSLRALSLIQRSLVETALHTRAQTKDSACGLYHCAVTVSA